MIPVVIIIILGILVLATFFFSKNGSPNKKYVSQKSTIDNASYYVLDFPDKQAAADTLAMICKDLTKFFGHLQMTHPNNYGVKLLGERFHSSNVKEGFYDFGETTYTESKKYISLCMPDSSNTLHSQNVLMFVMLHELAHMMNAKHDNSHDATFKKDFDFLKTQASEYGIYVNLAVPVSYCQISITHS